MRYPLALAILTASVATAWLAPARAEAVFPQGPCSGILCGVGTGDQRPAGAPPPTPQNCGGLLCDMGTRGFPTAGGPVAAVPEPAPPPAPECGFFSKMTNSCPPPPPPVQAQLAPPPEEPVSKHRKHKHVAAKRTPAPADATAAADKAN